MNFNTKYIKYANFTNYFVIHWQPLQHLETRCYKIRTHLSIIYTIHTAKQNAQNIQKNGWKHPKQEHTSILPFTVPRLPPPPNHGQAQLVHSSQTWPIPLPRDAFHEFYQKDIYRVISLLLHLTYVGHFWTSRLDWTFQNKDLAVRYIHSSAKLHTKQELESESVFEVGTFWPRTFPSSTISVG